MTNLQKSENMAEVVQNNKLLVLLQLLVSTLLSFDKTAAVATLQCPDCGKTTVPYPLSTSPSCGDQLYKVRCNNNAGKLFLDAYNESSYAIKSISPKTQHLIIGTTGYYNNTCIAADIQSEGIWLNESLPFKISSGNTVFRLNCSKSSIRLSPMDCDSRSPCYEYLNSSRGIELCSDANCCSYTTGGSKTAYRVQVEDDGCTGYMTFVNLNTSLPVTKWADDSELQIQWETPGEPICKLPADCQRLLNSTCLPDHAVAGQNRCFCNKGLQWDPINAICDRANKCRGKKHCPHHINLKKLYEGLTFSACGIVIIIIFLVLVKQHKKYIKREAHLKLVKQREEILNSNNHGKAATLFSGKELKRSTNNFSKEHLLGAGGFGEVYKGSLEDGSLAAIKKAKNCNNTLGMDQVLNEVCILCQVNHRSLVRLLGCCLDLDQPVLVYEYIPNGTLYEHLHGRYSNEWGTLTWLRRLVIAKQTAEGLAYLHFSAVPPIFHRDIKSSNILLDVNLDAKVADFGLSRLVDVEGTHISTCAQGTLGYLDPEYYQNYQLTDRSDVYSFGVVLLELLTSMKAIDFSRDDDVNLVVYVSNLVGKDGLMEAIDPGLMTHASNLELETMKAFGLLAVACVDEQRKNRPSMREVTQELEYIIEILAKDSTTLL